MYKDYQEAVVRYYHYKKERKEVSPRLLDGSPANVKAECITVFLARYQARDFHALRTIFGECDNRDAMLRLIKKTELPKFKPVGNYLNGTTRRPDAKIYELLGWLIDFPHRPYDSSFDYRKCFVQEELTVEETPTINNPEKTTEDLTTAVKKEPEPAQKSAPYGINPQPEHPPVKKPVPEEKKNPADKIKKRLLVAAVILVFAALGIYFTRVVEMPFGVANNGNGKCMIWKGDEYVTIPCPKAGWNPNIVRLNPDWQKRFQRINRPDTITERSIGKIGYVSRNGKKEYFTVIGPHPETHKDVRPLSKLIYEKYILPLKENGK